MAQEPTKRASKRRRLDSTPITTTTTTSSSSTSRKHQNEEYVDSINALSLQDFCGRYWPHDFTSKIFPSSSAITTTTTTSNGTKAHSPTTTPPPVTLRLKLASPSTWTHREFNACFDLVESMNAADYRASSIGWNEGEKREQMLDPGMKYLLLSAASSASDDGEGGEGRGGVVFWDGGVEVATKEKKKQSTNPVAKANGNKEKQEDEEEEEADGDHTIDKSVLGFISFLPTLDTDSPFAFRALYVYEIHLHPRLQNLGLGAKLITLVERLAAEMGMEKTMLTVFRRNERARRVYEGKCGWAVDGSSPRVKKMRNGRTRDGEGYVILSKMVG